MLETQKLPTPQELNKLLSKCKEKTHPQKILAIALDRSFCCLSVFNNANRKLVGFVRATTDNGLNANLWNLVAEPGDHQKIILSYMINRILIILKRDLPGCSISVSSPEIAISSLQSQGFLLDPNGIRAMAFRLR